SFSSTVVLLALDDERAMKVLERLGGLAGAGLGVADQSQRLGGVARALLGGQGRERPARRVQGGRDLAERLLHGGQVQEGLRSMAAVPEGAPQGEGLLIALQRALEVAER